MHFHNYASRILSLNNHEELYDAASEKEIKKQLQLKNGKMRMNTARKSKLTQLKFKISYFSDGVISLHFAHLLLNELNNYKINFGKNLKK